VFERVRNIVTLAIALLASLVNPPAVTSQTSHHVPLKIPLDNGAKERLLLAPSRFSRMQKLVIRA